MAEAHAPNPLTEAEINALSGEDPYIGETDWRGNRVTREFMTSKE